MSDVSKSRCFVTYETRFSGRLNATPGLAVLIASLGKHMPDIPLLILHTEPCDNLKEFAAQFGPPCEFRRVDQDKYRSWYGKPNAILTALDLGYDRVCWVDTDVIFTRDCTNMLFPKEKSILRITQEASTPHCVPERHVAIFGSHPVVPLGTSVSSAIICATRWHRKVLELWSDVMRDKGPSLEMRWDLFHGDQEYLETVLMNVGDEKVQIHPLINNIEHLHCIRGQFRAFLKLLFMPKSPIVHCSPYKSWWPLDRPFEHGVRGFLDCTPYTIEARRFREFISRLDGCAFLDWLRPSTARSKICLCLPPWTLVSPLIWYLIFAKLFGESYAPAEAERRIASALEAERYAVQQA